MRQHRGMKPTALLLALAAASAGAQPASYVLDPAHSFVHFEVLHFGTSTSSGRFGPVTGEVTLDRSAGRGEVGLRIDTAGVDTGLPVFNARLRQPDLLASTEYPEAYFVARNFRFEGQRVVEVRGEFTLRGVSQPLSLHARHFACRDGRRHRSLWRRLHGRDPAQRLRRHLLAALRGRPRAAAGAGGRTPVPAEPALIGFHCRRTGGQNLPGRQRRPSVPELRGLNRLARRRVDYDSQRGSFASGTPWCLYMLPDSPFFRR